MGMVWWLLVGFNVHKLFIAALVRVAQILVAPHGLICLSSALQMIPTA